MPSAAATDRIGQFPSAGSLVHAGLRRHFLDRFPYVLYYARTRLAYSSSRAFTWRGGRSIRWTGCVANKRIDTDKPRPASLDRVEARRAAVCGSCATPLDPLRSAFSGL